MKKIKFFLFAMLLLISELTGCAKQMDNPSTYQITYIPEHISLTSSLQSIDDVCVVGDTIYLFGKTDSNDFQILRFSAQVEEMEEPQDYQSVLSTRDGFPITGTLRAGTDGTLWVMERLMCQSISEDREEAGLEQVYILRNLDIDGKELARFEYSSLEEKLGLGMVTNLLIDSDGSVFAEADQGVALLDEAGEAQFIIKEEDWFSGNLILLGNGQAGVTHASMDTPGEYTYSLQLIDKAAKRAYEGWTLVTDTANLVSVYGGDADTLFYFKIGDYLFAWQNGDEESTQITNLFDIGIESDLKTVSLLTDERLVLLSGYDASNISLDILTPTNAGSTQDKKILTYATLQLVGEQREAIMAFNKSSKEYHISVTDYSQYGGVEAALTRLVTEIGAGKMPDILDLYGIPVSQWAAKGLLEDLCPYIDRDPDISREDLMERVFQAAEINGKLYQIGQYFWMSTLTGSKSVVGNRMTWTAEDMWRALKTMPEDCIPTSDSRNSMLQRLMSLDWSRFVDWDNRTCSFESEEFKLLLEFCAGFPEDTARLGEQGLYTGRQMLLSAMISGFEFPQRAKFLLGGDISYIGCPNEWGEVGSSFSFVSSVAMSSACKDKEGAWAFLRTLLLPRNEVEIQTDVYNYFPVNKTDFQKAAELAMTPAYQTNEDGTYSLDKNEERIEIWKKSESFDGIVEDCRYYATTQEEYDQLMALYHAIDTYNRWDSALESIIVETAAAYFAGDKSLDEATSLIQSRANLYINEQT